MLGFNLLFLGVYRVQNTTKEAFFATTIHVKMQCHHLYTVGHAVRATKVTIIYRIKHGIINSDMV